MTTNVKDRPPIATERRNFKRVQDAVGLELELLVDLPAAGEGTLVHDSSPRKASARRKNKYDIDGYGEVKREYPAVADYIDELEERIRTLAMRGDVPSEIPTHKVSLSGGGLAFADDKVFQPGDLVRMHLTLFPDLNRINCDGTIVSVGEALEVGAGDKHTYRLVYSRIAEADRQLIDKHVSGLRRTLPNEGE